MLYYFPPIFSGGKFKNSYYQGTWKMANDIFTWCYLIPAGNLENVHPEMIFLPEQNSGKNITSY